MGAQRAVRIALSIRHRCGGDGAGAGHLIKAAGYHKSTAQTGTVTLVQRFGSALNLNIHFYILFLDGCL